MSDHEHVRAFGSPFCAGCGYYIGLPEQTSPSRARPSALPYALEKLEEIESSARQCAGAGSIGGLNVASLQAAMLRLADQVRIIANEVSKEIDTSPEARAGDCDAIADDDSIWTDLEILEASSRVLQDSNPLMSVDIGHAVQNIVRRLTTKATP